MVLDTDLLMSVLTVLNDVLCTLLYLLLCFLNVSKCTMCVSCILKLQCVLNVSKCITVTLRYVCVQYKCGGLIVNNVLTLVDLFYPYFKLALGKLVPETMSSLFKEPHESWWYSLMPYHGGYANDKTDCQWLGRKLTFTYCIFLLHST